MKQQILVISTGEPAGVGPDIAIKAALEWQKSHFGKCARVVLVGDIVVLKQRAQTLSCNKIRWLAISNVQNNVQETVCDIDQVSVFHVPLNHEQDVVAGLLNPNHAPYVLNVLDQSLDLVCEDMHNRALVTSPVHKEIIHRVSADFLGHTEYLAQRMNVDRVVMMLATEHHQKQKYVYATQNSPYERPFRIALATTHVPLKNVSECLSADGVAGLLSTLRVLHRDLIHSFGIKNPTIFVAGLNPHAGEGGVLGNEEITIITPAIKMAQQEGVEVKGPFSADTLFQPKYLNCCDVVLTMFHDQGLPVLKYAGFGDGVNITLGLPIVRTSVDHGTALDLAGKDTARFDSMFAALQTAYAMMESRSKINGFNRAP